MAEGFLIGEGVRNKLKETFRVVDAMQGGGNGPTSLLRTTFDNPENPPVFRIGTFGTAAWSINSSNTVTLTNVGVTGYTVLATNVFGTLPAMGSTMAGTTRTCAVAKDGTSWYLIQPLNPGGGSVKLARTSSDWEKNSSMSLAVYGGSPGYESATGETVTAYNNFGKVLSGKWVMIGETPDGQNYLIAPESDQVEVVYTAEIVSTTSSGVTTSKLVFRRKKVWVHSIEEGTPIEIGMTECVTPYSNNQGGY
jgi:hypothetical protein